jgi:hypothetical protein
VLVALLRHDHEAAVAIGREVCELNPAYTAARQPYLAALGHLHSHKEAAVVREQLLAQNPRFTVTHFLASSPLAPAGIEYFAAGLRLAHVPEA